MIERADNQNQLDSSITQKTVKEPLWIFSLKQMRTNLCEVRSSVVTTLKESLWFGGEQPSRHEGGQM